MPKDPMPLDKLPGYIHSNNTLSEDSCVVVDMGKIVTKKKFPFSSIALATTFCLLLGFTTAAYNLSSQQITVVVNLNEGVDPQEISNIVNNSGGKIISVKQEGSVYEVKVSTRKSRLSFLELLHKNKNIADVK